MGLVKSLIGLVVKAVSALRGKSREAKAKEAHDAELERARNARGTDPLDPGT